MADAPRLRFRSDLAEVRSGVPGGRRYAERRVADLASGAYGSGR